MSAAADAGMPAASAATASSAWVRQVSKSRGVPYWFNTKTGASSWEMPAELRSAAESGGVSAASAPAATASVGGAAVARSVGLAPAAAASGGAEPAPVPRAAGSAAAVPARAPAAAAPAADPLRDPAAFHAANTPLLSAALSGDFARLQEELTRILKALAAGQDTLAAAPGQHRMPPQLDERQRFVLHDMADEFGLTSESFGAGDARHVVVWREGCPPVERKQADEDEARLAAEAEVRRKREAELAAAAAAERAAAAAAKGAGSKRKGGAGAELAELALEAVPLVPKRIDKRSVAEIQEDIREKKRRMAEAAAAGGGAAADGGSAAAGAAGIAGAAKSGAPS